MIIRPTLNELSRLVTTLTSAVFSDENLLPELQFAVLSRMMRTCGRSEGMFGWLRYWSVSSLTGSNTAWAATQAADSASARRSRGRFVLMVGYSGKSGGDAGTGTGRHADHDAEVVGSLRARERIGHGRLDIPGVLVGGHRLG